MANKAKETTAPKVNRNAVNAVAGAIANGLKTVNGTGSLLTQVCKVAHSMFKGKAIPSVDVAAILDDLSARMGWKGGTASVRRSEYKSVLVVYEKLGEAMAIFQKRAGKCTWHDGIALSRLLKKNTPTKSAQLHHKRPNAGNKLSPADRGSAKKQVAVAVKRIIKMAKLEKPFRDALAELCGEYGIKV
jgi:hypothetical protein